MGNCRARWHRRRASREGRQLLRGEGDLVAGGGARPAFADGTLDHATSRTATTSPNLARCSLRWRALRLPAAGAHRGRGPRARDTRACRALARARAPRGDCRCRSRSSRPNEILELAVRDPQARNCGNGWCAAMTVRRRSRPTARRRAVERGARGHRGHVLAEVRSRHRRARAAHGARPRHSRCAGRASPPGNAHRNCGASRRRGYCADCAQLELAPADGRTASLARAEYDGALRAGDPGGCRRRRARQCSYEIAFEGAADILGVHSTIPESERARQTLGGRRPLSHLEESPGGHGVRPARGQLLALDARRDVTNTRNSKDSSARGAGSSCARAKRTRSPSAMAADSLLRPVPTDAGRETHPRAAGPGLVVPACRARRSARSSRCPTC